MEDNRSLITYDENWQDVSVPEYPAVVSPVEQEEHAPAFSGQAPKRRTAPRQPVLTVQLVACILLALAAFVIKGIGGEVYAAAREWYVSRLNDTAVFSGGRAFELDSFFGATKDEAQAASN